MLKSTYRTNVNRIDPRTARFDARMLFLTLLILAHRLPAILGISRDA
jgi:hypothetical protein